MKWLIVCTVVLYPILSLIIGGTVIIGWQQPLPEQWAMLHLTDCAPPCWIGIVPGKTNINEARAQLRVVYQQLSSKQIQFPWGIENNPENIILFHNGTRLASIRVYEGENNIVQKISFDIAENLFDSWTGLSSIQLQAIIGNPKVLILSDQNSLNGYILIFGSSYKTAILHGWFVAGSCQNFVRSLDFIEPELMPDVEQSTEYNGVLTWRGIRNLEWLTHCN